MKVIRIDDFYRELKKYSQLEMGMINKSTIHNIFEKIKFDIKPGQLEEKDKVTRRRQFLQNLKTGCCKELTKNCKMDCKLCPCENCDKRFDCDGGNPIMGCNE